MSINFLTTCPKPKRSQKKQALDWKPQMPQHPPYGLPKLHKKQIPLRPIVSFTDLPTYDLAKELSSLQKPLIGKSKHQVKNSSDFASSSITNELLQTDEIMVSFDVVSLFRNRSNSLDIKHVQTTPSIRSWTESTHKFVLIWPNLKDFKFS